MTVIRQRCWALVGAVLAEDDEALDVVVTDLSREELAAMVEALAKVAAAQLTQYAPTDQLIPVVRHLAIQAALEGSR